MTSSVIMACATLNHNELSSVLDTMAKLRVLCLHGWRTNAKILKVQSEGLRQALGSRADFFYLDAPFLATGPAEESVRTLFENETPFFQWWDAIKLGTDTDGAPDAVTGKPHTIYSYDGLEHTLDFLLGQIHQLGPIDVLLGFSQGAALVTVMSAHYKKTYGDSPPWKACVLVAGFEPRAVETKHLLEDAFGNQHQVDIPSIHVLGKADTMFNYSERLFERYGGKEKGVTKFKFVHDEGHKFPSPSRNQALYADVASVLMELAGRPKLASM